MSRAVSVHSLCVPECLRFLPSFPVMMDGTMELGAKVNTPVTFVRAFCHSTRNKLGQEWELGPCQRLLAKAGLFWCDEAPCPTAMWGKGFLWFMYPHHSPQREAKARVQGRSQETGLEAETMKNTGYWFLSCGSLSLLFYTPRVIFSGVALPRVLWALPHQSLRKMPYRLAYRPVC